MTRDLGSAEGRVRAVSLRPPALAVRDAVTGCVVSVSYVPPTRLAPARIRRS